MVGYSRQTEICAMIPLKVIYYFLIGYTHRAEVDVIEQLAKVDFLKSG